MALIKCSECAHEISDKATLCPKCGNKIAIVEEKQYNYNLNCCCAVGSFGVCCFRVS